MLFQISVPPTCSYSRGWRTALASVVKVREAPRRAATHWHMFMFLSHQHQSGQKQATSESPDISEQNHSRHFRRSFPSLVVVLILRQRYNLDLKNTCMVFLFLARSVHFPQNINVVHIQYVLVCVFSPGTSKMCTIISFFHSELTGFNWAWLAVTICGPVMEWDWTNPPKIFKRIEKYKVATLTTHLSPVKWMNITSDSTITSSHSERKYNKAESLLSPQSLVIPNRHNSANEAQGSVSRCNYH